MFVDFIPDWSLDLRLITTEYRIFEDVETEVASCIDHFKKALKLLNSRLFQEEPPILVPLAPADSLDFNSQLKGSVGQGVYGRATNMRLIPLEEIVRAVCF